jgi:hypothetical protein
MDAELLSPNCSLNESDSSYPARALSSINADTPARDSILSRSLGQLQRCRRTGLPRRVQCCHVQRAVTNLWDDRLSSGRSARTDGAGPHALAI